MHLNTPIHLPTLRMSEWLIALGCASRVFVDSTRTEDIMVAEELTADAQLRYLLSDGVFSGVEASALLCDKPSFVEVDLTALATLPEDTLGAQLAHFHARHGLSPSVYHHPIQFVECPDAAFLMQRIRHSHDVWHVLTGLGVQGHEEILLHAFSLAQTGLPSSVVLALLGSLKHMVLEGRANTLLRGMPAAYRSGAAADCLLGIYWERYFDVPVEELRRRYSIQPLSEYA